MKFLTSLTDKVLKCFSLVFISAILVFVPLKILSYGWAPNYAMLISSALTQSSDIPLSQEIIKESIKDNTTIYEKAKETNLIYIVTGTFIVFNIIGLCFAPNSFAWFVSLIILMIANDNFIIRVLNCSPQILLCLLLFCLYPIFSKYLKEHPKTASFAIILYIFMLRSIIPPEVYAINEINLNYKYFWTLPLEEFLPLLIENNWLFFAFLLIGLSSYKNKTKFIHQFDNPILFCAFFFQLLINLGYSDLAMFRDSLATIWMTESISEIINKSDCFKELRVKIAMGSFVLVVFFLVATHDGLGRYSKEAIERMPVNFSLKELKGWAPEPGGIIYNDSLNFAISQYYSQPNAEYSYIYLNNFSLFENERENIININRMLKKKKTPLPDFYENWVDQMTSKDRLITSKKINGLDNIEWLRCGRVLWLGKLKNNK